MSHSLILSLIVLIVLIFASAFFSTSETGMMAINRYRLRHLARRNNRTAQRALRLLEHPDRLLGVILIGNNLANMLAASLATLIAFQLLGEVGVLPATILLTLIVLIFAEIAPKTLAALYPERVAFAVTWPLSWILIIFYPVVWLVNVVANGFLKLLGVKVVQQTVEALNSEELRTMVYESRARIPVGYHDILLSVLDLERMTVNDVMLPRNEIVGIDLEDEWDSIVQQLVNTPHSYLIVYTENIDQVKGILSVREILPLLAYNQLNKETLLAALKPVYCVPEETPLYKQLLNFRQEKKHLALIVDEYGDIQGLITLADILEEIVGEFDQGKVVQMPDVYQQNDGSYLVAGSASVRELNRLMGWDLPTDGPKTLSGLIVEYLENIPSAATCLRLAGYPIEIVQVQSNRIKTARIYPELRQVLHS